VTRFGLLSEVLTVAYPLIRHLTILVVLGATLIACSGGGAVTTPSGSSSPATIGAATTGPTSAATAAQTAAASTVAATPAPTAEATTAAATPAATTVATEDLESLMPTEVGGITLTPESIDTDQFMDAYPAFAALLGVVGKTPADVSIVQAQGSNPQTSEIMTVQAFRVAGADATAFMDAMLDFWKVTNDVAEPITIGDKELIVLGSPETQAQYKTYYYGYGDVIFRLGYNGDNFDEQMAALVSALP
jgi:hypothetical protein